MTDDESSGSRHKRAPFKRTPPVGQKKNNKSELDFADADNKKQLKSDNGTNNKEKKNNSKDEVVKKKTLEKDKKFRKVVARFVAEEPFVCPLFLKFARSTESEEFAHELVHLFYLQHGHTDFIIDDVIYYMHQETPDGNDLLRSTTLPIATLSECVRVGGYDYLKKVLGPPLKQICGLNDGQKDDLQLWSHGEQNYKTTFQFAAIIINRIFTSSSILPMFIKQLMLSLYKALNKNKKSPVSGVMIVSSFLFLRFLCPALVTPQNYGLLKDKPPVKAQRVLVAVARLMQALINRNIDPTPDDQKPLIIVPSNRSSSPDLSTNLKRSSNPDLNKLSSSPSAYTPASPSKLSDTDTSTSTSPNRLSQNLNPPTNLITPANSDMTASDTTQDSTTPQTENGLTGSVPVEEAVNVNTLPTETPVVEEENESTLTADFIKQHSPRVEPFSAEVLDKNAPCNTKRTFKARLKREHGALALQWMQDNKLTIVDHLMRTRQIRDKLAFEQFLSKMANEEYDATTTGTQRSLRVFNMGRKGKKEKDHHQDDGNYEQVRRNHKKELKATKSKEKEASKAREKEKAPLRKSGNDESGKSEKAMKRSSSGPITGNNLIVDKKWVYLEEGSSSGSEQ